MTDSIVIIPTYNEKENIENIIRAVFGLEKEFHILIIDDGSPDGTATIVKKLQQEFPDRLFLVERFGKQGLGTAYICGFNPLDGELETALKFAAERGVDVHLILPGKPDKRIPYALAKTHYAALIRSGVKISEWVPGFVHAKVFVVDDREAVVGTINLDYRSLYHHFEDAVWMVDAPCIPAIEDDFQRTLTQCRTVEATTQSIWQGQTLLRLTGRLVKAIAPLL